MITMMEFIRLFKEGKPLPQDSHPRLPDADVALLQWEAGDLFADFATALEEDNLDSTAEKISGRVDMLVNQYGWYNAAAVLALTWSRNYEGFDLTNFRKSEDADVDQLAKVFVVTSTVPEDPAKWSFALAMLATSSREVAAHFIEYLLYVSVASILSRIQKGAT